MEKAANLVAAFFWVFAGDLLGWALLDGLRAMDVGVLMAGGSRFTHPT
jgi:hypothetical protein